ncbi:hypothetical protein V1505DRAFT_357610 [Lipomyces doorenjongii]
MKSRAAYSGPPWIRSLPTAKLSTKCTASTRTPSSSTLAEVYGPILETYKLVKQSNAEAVFESLCNEIMVFGMRSRRICAYGPILDS